MFSIVGTEFSSVPLLRGCETAMKFVLVQLRPRVGRGWWGGGRHQTNLSLAIYSIIYRYILYNDIKKDYCKVIYDMYITQKCIRKLLHRYKARSWGNNCPFDPNLLINIMSEKRIFLANILWPGGHAPLYARSIIYFKFQYLPTFYPNFFSLRYPLSSWYLPCKKRSRSSARPIPSLQLLNAPLERRSKFTLLVPPQSSTSWHKSGLWINLYSKLYCRCNSFI